MKTTFRRQLTLMLCLLLAATLLIGVSFWLLFDRYFEREQEKTLQSTALSVGTLASAYRDSYLYDWNFRTNLSVAATASEKDILICSLTGEVQLCATELQDCGHIGKMLPQKELSPLLQASSPVKCRVDAIYEEERPAVAYRVQDDYGQLVCIVVVSMQESTVSRLMSGPLRIFFLTAVLVIVLMLLLAPLLTRREAKPLRILAAAARQIAHGNLEVRVPTGNRVEELEELSVAFNNMALALQNSETVRKEFVANVSHELKTPMTTIAGYLDGMLDGTIPPERHKDYMGLVAGEARRLSRMVRSMLDASRLRDQGIAPQQRKNFDICEAAGQALLSFEQRIVRKNLTVEIDMPESGVLVNAEPDSITQVLYNLLDNAVKFIDENGILGISVKKRADSALVSISNTGPTIAREELPLIFDRFHKTDKSRSDDRDGVGLGLYIVKTIIMAHGEDIYVHSRDGKTEFTFSVALSK
ncbi:MAG: HAMP domain-containing histidine kinase [Ruminococcaceae bacterium]|nr:HAMP domain-containing histidine kinase [Oscillospiraceae bacterium]